MCSWTLTITLPSYWTGRSWRSPRAAVALQVWGLLRCIWPTESPVKARGPSPSTAVPLLTGGSISGGVNVLRASGAGKESAQTQGVGNLVSWNCISCQLLCIILNVFRFGPMCPILLPNLLWQQEQTAQSEDTFPVVTQARKLFRNQITDEHYL